MMLVEVNIRNPLQADKDSAGDLDNCLERVQLKVVRTCASEYGLNAFSRLLAFDCAVGRSINEVPTLRCYTSATVFARQWTV